MLDVNEIRRLFTDAIRAQHPGIIIAGGGRAGLTRFTVRDSDSRVIITIESQPLLQ